MAVLSYIEADPLTVRAPLQDMPAPFSEQVLLYISPPDTWAVKGVFVPDTLTYTPPPSLTFEPVVLL